MEMDAGVAVRASLQMLLDKVPWRGTWAVPGSPVCRCAKRAIKEAHRDDAMKDRTVTVGGK